MTLVSVITPTWQRHDLLVSRCIPSVQAQTWPKVEHVIVSDGPDVALRQLLADLPVVYDELPTREDGPHRWGSEPRNRGAAIAGGELIAYLDDDNAYRPEHLQALAEELLANPQADFAYSQMMTYPQERLIGAVPPTYGYIDTSLLMHRADTLEKFGAWPESGQIEHSDQHAPDWGVVARWLDRGAKWVHVPRVTVDYWIG